MIPAAFVDTVRPGALLGGKYRVIRKIGEGAMGKVVLARHEELEQDVAIKLLLGPGALDAERVERFLREARAAAKLRSEHGVRVSDVGRFEAIGPYIVMEYLSGLDLDKLLTARGPLPPAEAVDHLLEALDAISEAHAQGIVHRDIKPSNLFLADGPDGTKLIKVLDFGISKQLPRGDVRENKLTSERLSLGTPAFMSPEQLKDSSDVDARADIWSIGVVLYELVTGLLPFKGEIASELLANMLTEDPIPLATRRPDAPPGLEEVIRRCLQRDRNARFPDVAALAEAMAPFGTGAKADEVKRIALRAKAPPSPVAAQASVVLDDEATILDLDDPATLKRKGGAAFPRAPVSQVPTQATWRVFRSPDATQRRNAVLAAVGGGGAALLIIAVVAMTARRGGEGSAPAAGAGGVETVGATATPTATATATATLTATATPTATSTATATATPAESESSAPPAPPRSTEAPRVAPRPASPPKLKPPATMKP